MTAAAAFRPCEDQIFHLLDEGLDIGHISPLCRPAKIEKMLNICTV
jgi:hypothetical protein